MGYRNDVAEARRLKKRSEEDQWRLAELTWQNVTPQGEASRRQWATDVDLSASYVGYLTRVWGEYGGAQRLHTFADALAKVISGDATTTSERARVESSITSASPAAVVKAVEASPDLQRALARNETVAEAILEESVSNSGYTGERQRPTPAAVEAFGPTAFLKLGSAIERVTRELTTGEIRHGKNNHEDAEELANNLELAANILRGWARGESVADEAAAFLAERAE